MSGAVFGVQLPERRGFSVPIRVVQRAGVSAWLVEERSVPVVSVAWSWWGGAALDAPGREGTAGLAAGMLTEGAGDLRSVAFQDALRDAGISLGFSAGRDSFDGGFRALSDALPEAVRLARLAMAEPRFDADAFDRLRARAVAGARQQLETPGGLARRAFWEAGFPGHPAGRLVTPESVGGATLDQVRAQLGTQLRRGGLLVTASGAISESELAALLEQLFGALPEGAVPEPPPLPAMTSFGQRVVDKDAPQSALVFGQPAPPPSDPGWEALQVAVRILAGGGFTSRLMKRIREERGLSYGIGAGLDVLFRGAVLTGSVSTDNPTVGEVWRLVREGWAEMAEQGPTEEEVRDAVSFLSGSLPLQFTDSRRTAGVLLNLRQVGRPVDWLERRPQRLAALTREGVAEVARRVLRPDALSLAVAGKPSL